MKTKPLETFSEPLSKHFNHLNMFLMFTGLRGDEELYIYTSNKSCKNRIPRKKFVFHSLNLSLK